MSQDYANRRKVRGLTKLGRMVSEDPDIDNLLSNLSPEELQEVEREVMNVPEPDPSEITLVDQTDSRATNTNSRNSRTDDARKSFQRNVSVESDGKESRKQEYLRKMGWSQEKKDSALQRQDSVSCSTETRADSRRSGVLANNSEGPKEEAAGAGLSSRWRRQESKDVDVRGRGEKGNEGKPVEKKDTRESLGGSSKTQEMISKLQEKKEDSREKERREDVRRRGDSKMKGLISKMEEKREEESKERLRKEEVRKRDDSKTKDLVSRLQERESQHEAAKAQERRRSELKGKPDTQAEKTKDNAGEKEGEKKEEPGKKESKGNEAIANEKEEKVNANGDEATHNAEIVNHKGGDEEVEEEEEKIGKSGNETTKSSPSKNEPIGNCVAPNTPKPKTKEEEEEEESTSMFDETMKQVRSNDPTMTELNVNNSEVIKVKTLIQFAEALRDNTHIKAFALANCRADDHVAYAIAATLRVNKVLTSINLDSNLLTSKGIMSLVQALQHNATLTELRFHNQRHICGGKSEMEMTKILKDNTTLLKLGYHFELAGPRMTMTNILSRNMDRQRQRRLQEQKQAQANGSAPADGKGGLQVPKTPGGFRSPKASPKPSPQPSPMASPKSTPRRGKGPGAPPPPPPPGPGGAPPPPPPPPAPLMDGDFLKNSLTPVSQRKTRDETGGRGAAKNSRDQLLASIRGSDMKQLKKVPLPKLLQ